MKVQTKNGIPMVVGKKSTKETKVDYDIQRKGKVQDKPFNAYENFATMYKLENGLDAWALTPVDHSDYNKLLKENYRVVDTFKNKYA